MSFDPLDPTDIPEHVGDYDGNIIGDSFYNNEILSTFNANNIGGSVSYNTFYNNFSGNTLPNIVGLGASYFQNNYIETDMSGIDISLYPSIYGLPQNMTKKYIKNQTYNNPVLYYFNSSNVMTFINL